MSNNRKVFGMLMMLAASVLFSTGGILCKLIPWSALAINGARNLLGGIIIGIYILATKHKLKFNFTVFVGAVCMAMVTTLFVLANKLTTAASAIVLQYSAPIWIIIISAIFLKKKTGKLEFVTIGVVILGIVFFFLDGLGKGNTWGDVVAILAGLFYAGLFVMNSFPKGDSLSSLFFGQLGCGILLSPFIFMESDFSVTPVISVLALGIFQVGVAYLFFNLGTKYTAPVTASIISGIEPILNSVLVMIFVHEMLSPFAIVGGIIVILSVIIYNVIIIKRAA